MRETLVAKFKVCGNLRFLSHQETVKLIQRALVRSRAELLYSQGFNPRPRLSLPLPRSVGLCSDDELFCVAIASGHTADELKQSVNAQLPEGCEIISTEIVKGKVSLQPKSVVYTFPVGADFDSAQRASAVKQLNEKALAGESIVIERQIDEKGTRKQLDVCGFIERADVAGDDIKVRCKTGQGGSIRPAEILNILGIAPTMLAGAIKRSDVQWQRN